MSMPAEQLTTTRCLSELLRGFADAPACDVFGIASDSRSLKPGDLFLACGGENNHGLDYVSDALTAGVAAIAWDSSTAAAPKVEVGIPLVAVPRLARHLGDIANRFYGHPSATVRVAGVTGTNGKTTVAWLIAQCCEQLDFRCGYVGTLGTGIGEIESGAGMTTPGAVELHGSLADFRDQGAVAAVIEVSSHALAQNRVDGVVFDSVLFTNLSRDHLDYHGDMHNYAEAKAKLFLEHSAKHRIINLDSEFGTQLADRCGQDVVTVSTKLDRVENGRPYVFVRSVIAKNGGSKVGVNTAWGDGEFALHLPGDFNVANAVIVLALLLRQGVPMDKACDVLSTVSAPPGRMQRVAAPDASPSVYVDYAHTPAAIDVALRALKTHCKGKLWCVFGCGGDRDAGKRAQMGKMAERRADRIVVTSDNPRNEEPADIIAAIVTGLGSPERATIIEDRAAAIAWTIAQAAAEDVVLIAGKGHENYQLIGADRIDFSDYGVAQANLARKVETGE
ncbi:MAG: UDP-N-acetylmuramoyl-L-alanyl-D-glutamate--2,6-diaminopimelate ligase [Gammaproteobacteria bacterium]|nr:UDP-N-acetylmuramoyl-L-alanyl-D-glutamate--2,6-diaminopimelate ligase [Gammaproteobacteria bacterium]MDH3748989.1 UDP-N-acetylmuramoyl-L-alanyl-D-glutamate--2,6-diaminopimelate ligase [Gammaproteobacteria bacterium]MDH3806084.1 UDP-N-acetylmuramoyl-L-alanyl-D-glutamate--2,6-diaminopimelate ligase [Gammaproteobacteria bacterium]